MVEFGWLRPDAGEYFRADVEGEITAIYVRPSAAREGVGSRIRAALEARAVREGIKSLGLWASRNAVPFYKAQGYDCVTDHAHEYGDVELTAIEIEKRSIRVGRTAG